MKLYEDSKRENGTRQNRCGYCRGIGHNRTECPQVAEDWKYWSNFEVPPHEQGWYRSRKHPKYWGEWYEDCRITMLKQEAKRKEKKPSTPVVRAAPKCGFCGSEGHNRRNCPKMAAFIQLCTKANHNYRKKFYEVFIKAHGIEVGSAVELTKKSYYNGDGVYYGIITKINLDEVNVFTAYNYTYDSAEKYGQNINIEALVDNQVVGVNLSTFCEYHPPIKNLVKRIGQRYSSMHLTKVIGRSEAPLSDDWVHSYNDAWEFLAKKRSYKRLKEEGVVRLIEQWANLG